MYFWAHETTFWDYSTSLTWLHRCQTPYACAGAITRSNESGGGFSCILLRPDIGSQFCGLSQQVEQLSTKNLHRIPTNRHLLLLFIAYIQTVKNLNNL